MKAVNKTEILKHICYTDLVYGRINKKLKTHLSKPEIEKLIYTMVEETDESMFERIGKNIYVTNVKKQIRITINSNTCRIITVDKL